MIYLQQIEKTFYYDHLKTSNNVLMELSMLLVPPEKIIYLCITMQNSQLSNLQSQHLVLKSTKLAMLQNLFKTYQF